MKRMLYSPLLSLLYSVLFLLSCHALSVPAWSDGPPRNTTLERRVGNSDNLRTVTWAADRLTWNSAWSPRLGRRVYSGHSFVEFGRTKTDGAMRVEITFDDRRHEDGRIGHGVRALDFTSATTYKGIRPRSDRVIVPLDGRVALTNEQIMSWDDGSGIALNIWGTDPMYRTGPPVDSGEIDPYNGCNVFAKRILQHPAVFGPGVKLPAIIDETLDEVWEYNLRGAPEPYRELITEVSVARVQPPGGYVKKLRRVFEFDPEDPESTWVYLETNPESGELVERPKPGPNEEKFASESKRAKEE